MCSRAYQTSLALLLCALGPVPGCSDQAGHEAPRLVALSVSQGQLQPAFSPELDALALRGVDFDQPLEITARVAPVDALLWIDDQRVESGQALAIDPPPEGARVQLRLEDPRSGAHRQVQLSVLPANFPSLSVLVDEDPAPGLTYLTAFAMSLPHPGDPGRYVMSVDRHGVPRWWLGTLFAALDFKKHPDATYSYYSLDMVGRVPVHEGRHIVLDENHEPVREIRAGGELGNTDNHDLFLLPDGHALILGYDERTMDLTALGGRPDARVIGLVIQEVTRAGSVVFEWSSWDHLEITDMVARYAMDSETVDYVHGNSIDLGPDGHLLVVCRKMDTLIKIHRDTGQVLWRLGGLDARRSDFQLLDDPLGGFSHPHHARWVAEDRILLFDNGTFHDPPISRAMELQIDEQAMTARLAWSHADGDFTEIMGSAQRLSNGHTLLGWGDHNQRISEVRPDGTTAWELEIGDGLGTYRAYRFE